MSAPGLAPAPVPVTAPTAAPLRRPAPVRAENKPDTFATVLDEATAPEAPHPAARPGKGTKTASADSAIEKTDKAGTEAAGTEAKADTVGAPLYPPPVAPPASKIDMDGAGSSLEGGTASVSPPALAPAPTPPVDAATLPAPSAAPVAAPLPVPEARTTDASSEETAAAADAETAETTLLPVLDEVPAAPRLRDTIDQAKTGNAAAAHGPSGNGQTDASGDDPGTGAPNAASPEGKPKDTASAASRTATEPASTAVAQVDSAEPAQPPQSATPAESRAAQAAAAATPVLSTLSQGAIHATAQIAAQIIKKLEGRSTRFEMALTPDDLGRVDVSLDIDADGQLSARLAFDNPLAAADLRGRVDELRRQLTDAGFTVADDALSFDQREPSADAGGFDRGHDRNPARAFGAASRLSLDAEASLVPPRWMSLTLTPERVDMKV
ncbi:flagellar hook-length control protein FliK [Brevundimonas sp. AJA228-03]|uniref:flagellar hook-length control protein FliK n=1 Tax=Brevundimonas sp. AJA228-03 TaxID=2752515 RepID=UPI001FD7C5E4|nr:flagellar hook-length control protein FliK [Brevundimonas sp. AJA228-03]